MNTISEQILSAVDIIVNDKVSKLEYDKTIQATIYSVDNLDKGEYKVRYNGNIFKVYTSDLTKTYKVNDLVFVSVPEGNFSNKKLIVSTVGSQSLSSVQLNSLQNSVFEISPTFDQLYAKSGVPLYDAAGVYGVVAGITPGYTGSFAYIYQGPQSYSPAQPHGLFQQYANNYDYIRIKGSFLTQFHSDHSKGNYGIEVEFYAKDNDVVSYKLDLSQFIGDPYGYSVYSEQQIVIKIQKNYLLGLKSIKLFEEEFNYDRIIKDGILTDEYNRTTPNIFVRDISVQYVDVKDLTQTSYYLMIAAPRGISFSDSVSSLDLVGRLIYNGNNIIDDNCECKWFKRDLSIMPGEQEYNRDVGFGWKAVESDGKTLTVNISDVHHQQEYKLLVIYNNDVKLTAETTVYNLNSSYSFHMQQNTDLDKISLEVINDASSEKLKCDWYVLYPDSAYQLKVKNQNPTDITDYLNYSSIVFYCGVHSVSDIYLGTLVHTITNSESEEDITITYIGEDTFRYDAGGKTAFENSERERLLEVKVAWKDGYATNYTIQWFIKDSNNNEIVLTGTRQKPEKSMINELWVDNYNILHYNILYDYQSRLSNNSVFIRIRTVAGQVYTFEKEILFIKDGDQGTNGTTYISAVRPCGTNDEKLGGFNPLTYNGRWGASGLPVKCYVYKDGTRIDNQPNKYDIKYNWSAVNLSINDIPNPKGESLTSRVTVRGLGTISASSGSSDLQFYVKCKTTITDSGKEIVIYTSYPVDVLVGNLNKSLVDISNLPSYIKYSNSGYYPEYYDNEASFEYNKVKYDGSRITSMNTNLLKVSRPDLQTTGPYYLYPTSNFIYENITDDSQSNIAILKCTYSSTQYIIHPIIMYLDTYGNEAINGWDGEAVEIDENGKYIFAPQIGAGRKDPDNANRFTGVIMGKDSGQKDPKTGEPLIGLYGYQSGENSFGLMEDGTAYFGKKSSGGQIVIDGKEAHIYGGGDGIKQGGDAKNGMSIFLANLLDQNTPSNASAIKIGGGVFEVTYDGKMVASAADIEGAFYAKEGKIGGTKTDANGWTIATNRLYSGSGNNRVELNSTPSSYFRIWAGGETPGKYTPGERDLSKRITDNDAKFIVTKDGFAYAQSAYIKGEIFADKITANTSGTIANWNISENKLTSGTDKGQVTLTSISDNSEGVVIAAGGSGTNAPFTLTNTGIISIARGMIQLGKKGTNYNFTVTDDGKITAVSGTIATWTMDKSGFYYDNRDNTSDESSLGLFGKGQYYLMAGNKSISHDATTGDTVFNIDNAKFYVDRQGNMTCKDGTFKDGSITIEKENSDGNKEIVFQADTRGNVSLTGKITANSGEIAGWKISEGKLYSGAGNKYVELNSSTTKDYTIIAGGTGTLAPFSVTKEGTVKAMNATIKGDVTATSGKISKWVIDKSGLYYNSTTTGQEASLGLFGSGQYYLVAGNGSITHDSENNPVFDISKAKFYVDRQGNMTCKNGTFENGSIKIEKTDSDGNIVTAFQADTRGNVSLTGTITAKSGMIADWKINENGLSKSDDNVSYYLSTTRGIKWGDNFTLSSGGNVTVKGTIQANKGKIGNWIIDGYKLRAQYDTRTDPFHDYDESVGVDVGDTTTVQASNRFYINANPQAEGGYRYFIYAKGLNGAFTVDRDGNITATGIKATGEITATALYIGNSGSNLISNDKVNGSLIETGSIQGTAIANGTITSDQIMAGTITANEIDVDKVQSKIVTADYIKALNIAAKEIEIEGTGGSVIKFTNFTGTGVDVSEGLSADHFYADNNITADGAFISTNGATSKFSIIDTGGLKLNGEWIDDYVKRIINSVINPTP